MASRSRRRILVVNPNSNEVMPDPLSDLGEGLILALLRKAR